MKTNEQLRAENQAIRDVLAANAERRLRAIPGVLHVSVGLRQKNGQATDDLCVRVYVRQKRSREELSPAELIPERIDGVATDVNTVAEVAFRIDNSRYRPIKGGIQITNRIVGINDAGTGTRFSEGTLGCLAIDNTDKAPVLLSNWHVLCANGGRAGDKIYQPAPSAVPPASLAELPLRPTDDTDKIGVIRRGVINSKVDGAIAAIDVSSCCHCCGIRYTNDIRGLSAGGHPPRTTIVGDQKAVSGMHVFQSGQATLRQEGVVIDANYPSITISKSGTTYTFDGQIAIQGIDASVPFADQGDSGSVVINRENKIVGLFFAATPDAPYIALANHIGDVLKALNIRIPYAAEVITTSGARLTDIPELEAPIPEPYRALRERMRSRETTARIFALGERHRDEVLALVNHRRAVTVAWHRCEGPAYLATMMAAVRDGHYRMPAVVKGVALPEALERMRQVLSAHGSEALRAVLGSPDADLVLRACAGDGDLRAVLDRISAGDGPRQSGVH